MQEPRSSEPDEKSHVILSLPPDARLRRLACADGGAAPYDFAEFQRRSSLASRRPVLSPARGAALAAAVSGLLLGAVLWQQVAVTPGGSAADSGDVPIAEQWAAYGTADTAADRDSPALVRVGSYVARKELEDRIAYFDAVLSESRVGGARPERLAALEQGRIQLVDSLQRVHYAERLIAP